MGWARPLQPAGATPHPRPADELISQIAAGHGGRNAASVVRRLVDNALDSSATMVTVRLLAGGVRLIAVEDDGERHSTGQNAAVALRLATSKIPHLRPPRAVATMGFRGGHWPPLPRCPSRPALAPGRAGQRLPARRAALGAAPVARQRPQVEVKNCSSAPRPAQVPQNHAANWPTAWRPCAATPFYCPMWALPSGTGKLVEQWRHARARPGDMQDALARRLADVLGEDFVAQSVPVQHSEGGSPSPAARACPTPHARSADQQYCYVNGRFVRDKVITHAARSATRTCCTASASRCMRSHRDRPARVDVNVHPPRSRCAFATSREVHQAVRHAVENALAVPALRPGGGTASGIYTEF